MTEYPSLKTLGRLVGEKRGKVGIRATAREIGLSPATLSRVENGQMPDLANFTKICRWLEIDPARVLGFEPATLGRPVAAVHFRSQATVSLPTAGALQELIIEAQRMLSEDEEDDEPDGG
ncbi:MAG: helix-turn-helix transcriptional regulator [Gemmatimonadota bacterium]|nr:helix-turn-helix transcriptional regulator [Gemmatimonadota bacterium]MDE2866045.1 helix-turn-helix transcriptional regulator [Gemmatimonadota bacterium]